MAKPMKFLIVSNRTSTTKADINMVSRMHLEGYLSR